MIVREECLKPEVLACSWLRAGPNQGFAGEELRFRLQVELFRLMRIDKAFLIAEPMRKA